MDGIEVVESPQDSGGSDAVYVVQIDASQMDTFQSVANSIGNIAGFQLLMSCILVGLALMAFFRGGWRHG